MRTLHMSMGAENMSPPPCSSHSLVSKVQTNLRDSLEHTVVLALCPAPSVSHHKHSVTLLLSHSLSLTQWLTHAVITGLVDSISLRPGT